MENIGTNDIGYDYAGQIIAYEMGELDEDETVELFQFLVDTGIVWQLQGSYQQKAWYLIDVTQQVIDTN